MSNLIDAMKAVNDLNRTHGVTQRGGKKYTEVFVRVEQFRMAFGEHMGIDTEILVDDGKRVVVKAIVTHKGQTIGSGMAEEIRGSSNVNKTSALENCETSAIGRALASLGLHGGSYASANEIAAVSRKEKAIEEQRSGQDDRTPPVTVTPPPGQNDRTPQISVQPLEPENVSHETEISQVPPWTVFYHNGQEKQKCQTDEEYREAVINLARSYGSQKRSKKQFEELWEANFAHIDMLSDESMKQVEKTFRLQSQ